MKMRKRRYMMDKPRTSRQKIGCGRRNTEFGTGVGSEQ